MSTKNNDKKFEEECDFLENHFWNCMEIFKTQHKVGMSVLCSMVVKCFLSNNVSELDFLEVMTHIYAGSNIANQDKLK